RYSPPCATGRRWLRHQENFAQPPKLTQPGWFSICFHRKTTPASRSAEASQSFFDRSATPPCGDARRGIALFQFFHSSYDRRQTLVSSLLMHCQVIFARALRQGAQV